MYFRIKMKNATKCLIANLYDKFYRSKNNSPNYETHLKSNIDIQEYKLMYFYYINVTNIQHMYMSLFT